MDPANQPPEAPGRFDRLYPELRRIGQSILNRAGGHSIGGTELVHEAWPRLKPPDEYESDRHFLSVAAKAMRDTLIDRARAKAADKRGGGRVPVAAPGFITADEPDPSDLAAAFEAVDRLEALEPGLADVIRFDLLGLGRGRIATALGLSESIVRVRRELGYAALRKLLEK